MHHARMAESVDALVSNTSAARRAGSIPASGTLNPRRVTSTRVFCFSDLEIGLIWSRFDSTLHKGDHIFYLYEEALTDSNCQFYRQHIAKNRELNLWKSPVCVTPKAQVPLTLESKFRMTPIKS